MDSSLRWVTPSIKPPQIASLASPAEKTKPAAGSQAGGPCWCRWEPNQRHGVCGTVVEAGGGWSRGAGLPGCLAALLFASALLADVIRAHTSRIRGLKMTLMQTYGSMQPRPGASAKACVEAANAKKC